MKYAVVFLSLLAAGCASKLPVYSRFDGAALNPVAKEQALAECKAKAQVASAQVPYSGSAMGRGFEQHGVEVNYVKGCLAEKGIKVEFVEQGT